MSAGNPGGAIQMVGQLDLSQPYAALAKFRQDASGVSVGGTFGAQSMPGAATAFTAATQAFEGGAQRFTAPVSFGTVAAGGYSGPAFAGAQQQMPMMQFGQQLQQLTIAVQQMTAAASRMASGAALTPTATVAATEQAAVASVVGGRSVGMMMPRSPRAAISRFGAAVGGLPGLGIAAGLEAGRELLVQNFQFQHDEAMAAMLGKTPVELAQMRLGHLEQIRNGGFMGSNGVLQGGADWLANRGVRLPEPLRRIPENERQEAATVRAGEEGQFLNESRRQKRELEFETQQELQPNSWIRNRDRIQRETAERNLSIMERFGTEQQRYDNNPMMRAWLGAQMVWNIWASNDEGAARQVANNRGGDYQTQASRSTVRRFGALIERRGLDADLEENQQRYNEAARNTPPSGQGALLNEFTQRAEFARLQQADRAGLLFAQINSRNQVLSISAFTHPENPALGAAMGQAQGIYNNAIISAFQASIDPDLKPDQQQKMERAQLRSGMLQALAERQNFRRSLRSEELDSVNQAALSGPGTLAAGDYQELLSDMAEKLANMQADLGAVKQAFLEMKDNAD